MTIILFDTPETESPLTGPSAPGSNFGSRQENFMTVNLFSPLAIGPYQLAHRVIMAPLTRMRASQPGNVPSALNAEYYAQRATEGGLIISEGSPVSLVGQGMPATPGIHTPEQIAGWQTVTDAVHRKGGKIYGIEPGSGANTQIKEMIAKELGGADLGFDRCLVVHNMPAVYSKAAKKNVFLAPTRLALPSKPFACAPLSARHA